MNRRSLLGALLGAPLALLGCGKKPEPVAVPLAPVPTAEPAGLFDHRMGAVSRRCPNGGDDFYTALAEAMGRANARARDAEVLALLGR